jgi:hypothetical protein
LPDAPLGSAAPLQIGGNPGDRDVRQAAQPDGERQLARRFNALPNSTPHARRRTDISIALVANNFDATWVQAQVGTPTAR